MTQPCPSCGQPTAGRFCSQCGAAAGEVACRECGSEIPTGGHFCNQCGAPVAAQSARLAPAEPVPAQGDRKLPWLITAVALLALLGVLLYPRLRPEPQYTFNREGSTGATSGVAGAGAAGDALGGGGDARNIDLSSMTPREAADRLFNRVMQNVSAGDTAQAMRFLPMALDAYRQVPDLDLDGHYHLGVLQLVGGDAAGALAEAGTILATEPNHLFGLFVAAQAEAVLGRGDAGRARYSQFVQAYAAEMAKKRPEYLEHAQALPPMRDAAEAALRER